MSVINTKIYGGELTLVFNSETHRYTVDGEKIPSVTGILGIVNKPALLYWAANMASDYWKESIEVGCTYDEVQLEMIWANAKKAHKVKKDESCLVGNLVHRWCEQYIKGEHPIMPTNPQVLGSVERFLKWIKDNDVKFLSSEQAVFSRLNKYCGTVDFFCVIKGKLLIGDIKTSNAIYHNSMGSQLAAYLAARTEEYPQEKYSGGILLRVGKESGELEPWGISLSEMQLFHKNFINCLNLTRTEAEIKKIYAQT